MKSSIVRLQVIALTIAITMLGCSKKSLQEKDLQNPLNTTQAVTTTAGPVYVDNKYIVVFKDAVTNVEGESDQISRSFNIKTDYRYKHAIKGFAATLPSTVVEALKKDPRVAYIEQDQMAHFVTTQTNPPSWGLDRIDQRSLPLDNSYSYNQTGVGVDAYIIDCGILLTHNDFGGRAVTGYDAITLGGTATDGNGHGTHVAGTVGGATYGVAKGVKLIAVRVLDNSGSGTYSQVIAGIDWVTSDHTTHPAVANMSLGGGVSTALDDAVRRSIASGVTYCIAAGNSSADASTASPADVVEAVTVGATDINDGFAGFSNFGNLVDISAPGVNITSDWNTSVSATNTISGTSMATPHVTGSAVLYLEANPTATPAAVQSALKSNGTPNKIGNLPGGTVNLLLYSVVGPAPVPTTPTAPALSTPADGAIGVVTNPTLSWVASAGATSYTVQVSTNSTFTSFFYNTPSITTTSTSLTGLANNTVYYWRVSASNSVGTSPWSSIWSFTTGAAGSLPGVPVLSSPANGATGVVTNPTLSWVASSGATSYTVQVSASSSFGTLVYNVAGITGTSTTASGLTFNSQYFWRVYATNSTGTSASSTVWSFTTKKRH